MERLPNFISCLRIALSIALLFLTDEPMLFAVAYFICGISDALDGYLARRLSAQTMFGSKLDSAGDFIFYMVCLHILLTFTRRGEGGIILTCVTIIAAIRVINLVITKVKFKHWCMMHTIGNKLTVFAFFLMLPVWVLANRTLHWSVIAVGLTAGLSALEEAVILLKSKTYHANGRSLLALCKFLRAGNLSLGHQPLHLTD